VKRRSTGVALGFFATFVLVLGFVPPSRASRERILLVTGVVYGCFLVRLRFGMPDRPDAEPPAGYVPPDDAAAEQDVRMARLDASLRRASETGEHYARVGRPMLRSLAAQRLRDRTGVDPDTDPTTARRLLGEELWQIFATPPDEHAPPPPKEELQRLVAAVERL